MGPGEAATQYQFPLSEGLWLIFRRDHETGGYVEMLIKNEKTSLEQEKRHWPEIKTWQQLLLEWQGPSLQGGANALIHRLDLLHAGGRSYTDLANMLNNTVARDLTTYIEDRRAFRRAQDADIFHSRTDITQWQQRTGHYGLGLVRAQSLLGDMGLKKADIQHWCASALRNLRQGRPPFPSDEGPITRDHLIMRLRA